MTPRALLPSPYKLQVYPIQVLAGNSLGNKTRKVADTPVIRSVQSIHAYDSGERIDPAYIDRVVTVLRIMVADGSAWKDGDQVVIPSLGRYQISADPQPRNLGPLKQFNYLLGARLIAKRVN